MRMMLLIMVGALAVAFSGTAAGYALLVPSPHSATAALLVVGSAASMCFLWLRSRRAFALGILMSLAYAGMVLIAPSMVDTAAESAWARDSRRLTIYAELADSYLVEHGKCPGASDIRLDQTRFGILLARGSCVVYAFGPDGDDDQAKKEVDRQTVENAMYFGPWRYMILAPIILRLEGRRSNIDGDVIRLVMRRD